jgi:SIR2-like domain
MSIDLGNFGKYTLLTGAGWSRNWGGRIASEVWQMVMDHRRVQGNPHLRGLLLEEPSFEVALGRVQGAPFTAPDKSDFEEALLATFASMDREISRIDHQEKINIYGIQRFLARFSRPANGVDTGYMFTLNQDLWPERYMYNHVSTNSFIPALPGVPSRAGQRWFLTNVGDYSDAFLMSPTHDLGDARLKGQMNIIKQHGSFNWRTGDAGHLMVIGSEKSNQIASQPLLSWYADIFRSVLNAGKMRLMIIGYGFGDEHINAAIAEAVANHGLSVFIWDTASDLKTRILAAPCGPVIWRGLISIASRSFTEVFPGNQTETEEYRRICRVFFAAH